MEIISDSLIKTKKAGEILAKEILKTKSKKAIIIGLKGDLGGGKTTFLQGFAKGLGIKEKVLSPTFIIMRSFAVPKSGFKFFHLDCYRIKKNKEIMDLGFRKIINDSNNIVAIEWADKIKKILPSNVFWIKFDFIDDKTRKIAIF